LAAAEFDRVAGVYDETRRALDAETLDGVMRALAAHGCRSILEIGVGTGRVAAPLKKRGVDVVGVDLSRRMMERARAKGLANLVLGDGLMTPFRGGSFDAVILAHVLHIIRTPKDLIMEGARVGRTGVFALVRKREGTRGWSPWSDSVGAERREWFRRLAEKYHWSWERNRTHDWNRERELLEGVPPDELVQVSDTLVTESLKDRIARVQKGAYSDFGQMPEGMREELVREMRSRASTEGARTRRQVYTLAFWRSDALRGSGARGPSGRARPP